jgi:hypothetical protein
MSKMDLKAKLNLKENERFATWELQTITSSDAIFDLCERDLRALDTDIAFIKGQLSVLELGQ